LIKAEAFGSPRFLFGLAFYAGGFVIWYLIMLRLPLSQAFPIAAGSLIIGTQIAGWWILEEVITIHHLIGLTLILAGVLFVFVRS
jgi:multidrug transporter EmrE-like cation transporter